jgi:hypothetical protein
MNAYANMLTYTEHQWPLDRDSMLHLPTEVKGDKNPKSHYENAS